MVITQTVDEPQIAETPGASGRWWALAALALAGLALGLDATVLNVALPELSTSLHATTSQLQWFVDAYTLVVAVAMLPAANLGDRYGRKRLLVASLVLFAVASAWCAFSTSAGELIAARAALGLAGAAFLPLGLAMVPALFPDRTERTRAISMWALASTAGLPLGPILGGLLLNHFWWGSVFLLNVPVAAFGAIALMRFLPETRSALPVALDVPGAMLSSLGLAAVIYGFINAGQHSWTSISTWASIGAGLALFGVFVRFERRSTHPLIELKLFTDKNFCWGTVHATIANFAFFGLLFVVPQYFQSINGTSPLGTGLRLLPMILGLVIGTRAAVRLMKRVGTGTVISIGFVLAAAGLTWGATTTVATGYSSSAAWIALLGLGTGIALPTSMNAALGALTAERAGAGAGLMQAVRQVGGAVGVALLGTVLATGYHSRLHTGPLPLPMAKAARDSVAAGVGVARTLADSTLRDEVRGAFVHGMDLTLLASSALVLFGAVLAARFLPRHTPVAAAQPASPPVNKEGGGQ